MTVSFKLPIRIDPETGYGEIVRDGLIFTSTGDLILGCNAILLDGDGIDFVGSSMSIYREPTIGAEVTVTSFRSGHSVRFAYRGFEWWQLFDDALFITPSPADAVDRLSAAIDTCITPVLYMLFVVLFFVALTLGGLYAIWTF